MGAITTISDGSLTASVDAAGAQLMSLRTDRKSVV